MIIIIGCACMVVMLMVIYFISRDRDVKSGPPEHQARQPPQRVHEGAARRAQMIRNRGARLRANAQARDSEDENAGDEEPEIEAENLKIGAKKRAKLEAKAEKRAQREAEEIARQDKKNRAEQAEDERRRAEEKHAAEERKREEAEKKEREDKERAEHEEYLKMKEAFSVEEEGYEDGEPDDEHNVLQEFVSYIKTQKVVIVEDLAAHFKLKTQAVIDRLRDLQNDNILTGVLDDRGKFIYVSQEEMEAVAKFIKQRGRVSIQELAENSNQLINLTPVITTNN